jgi:hypothetical protein
MKLETKVRAGYVGQQHRPQEEHQHGRSPSDEHLLDAPDRARPSAPRGLRVRTHVRAGDISGSMDWDTQT